tara:strand:+ start:346 stop:546 length:201 start_codon:yes stop_codon:yes gene_type:complete
MFLNIINNTVFENRRYKNMKSSQDNEEQRTDGNSEEVLELNISAFLKHNSIFYGELTKDWLSINQL